MATIVHLLITKGPDSGREIHVPPEGVRIGRSSRNDISIADEAMSRFQCRFYIQAGEGLWVSDLGSANGTMVNGKLVQEQRLHLKDEILAGDTRIRVVNDGTNENKLVILPPPAETPNREEIPVDLGLRTGGPADGAAKAKVLRRNLIWLAGFMLILVLIVWFQKPVMALFEKPRPVPVQPPANLPVLDFTFERIEGSSSNIFRYSLSLKKELLSVQVDDLQNDRHVRREVKVAKEILMDLAHSIELTGVLDLKEDYSGIDPSVYNLSDLSVTIGVFTRRIRVLNQVEPEIFATARSMIEEFGKNELGLAALAVEPATLVEKARSALLQGKKMWDEREVRNENLYNAIRAYKECEWYLETIQPKPSFYSEAINARTDCIRELQRRYEDLLFLAERSVKLGEWKDAERQLKAICEMIPDRSDDRNSNASSKLLEVERHTALDK